MTARRYTVWTWRNLLVLPVVLVVRIPVIGLLALLAELGRRAEWLHDQISHVIPGFERKRLPPADRT